MKFDDSEVPRLAKTAGAARKCAWAVAVAERPRLRGGAVGRTTAQDPGNTGEVSLSASV